jgi:hypothetical protein
MEFNYMDVISNSTPAKIAEYIVSMENIEAKPQNNYDVKKYQKLLKTARYLEVNGKTINDFFFKIKKLISYVVRVITFNKIILFKESLDVENIDPHLLKYNDKNNIGEISGIITKTGEKRFEFNPSRYDTYVCRHLSYAIATRQASFNKMKNVKQFMKQPFFNDTKSLKRPLADFYSTNRFNEVNDCTIKICDFNITCRHVLSESTLEDISELASILSKAGDEFNSRIFNEYIERIKEWLNDDIIDTKGIKIKNLCNPYYLMIITEELHSIMMEFINGGPVDKYMRYKLPNGFMSAEFAVAFLLSKHPISGNLVAQDNPDGFTYSCSFNSFNSVLKDLSAYVWNQPPGHCENFTFNTTTHSMALSIERYENNLKISFFDPNDRGEMTHIIVDSLEEINKINLPMLTSLSRYRLEKYRIIGADAKSRDLHLITLVNFRKLDNYKPEFTDIFSFLFRQKYCLANLTKDDLSAIVEDCKQQQITDFADRLQDIIDTNLASGNNDTPLNKYNNQEELINSIFQAIKDSLATKDQLIIAKPKFILQRKMWYISELIEKIFIKHLRKYYTGGR